MTSNHNVNPVSIETRFKAGFILKFCLAVTSISISTTVTIYSIYTKELGYGYTNAISTLLTLKTILMPVILFTFLFQIILLSIIVICITLFLSHRIAGPIFHLEKNLESIGECNFTGVNCKLRTTDQLQNLADLFADISYRLSDTLKKIKGGVIELENKSILINNMLEKENYDRSKLLGTIKEIELLTERVTFETDKIKLSAKVNISADFM